LNKLLEIKIKIQCVRLVGEKGLRIDFTHCLSFSNKSS